MSPSLPFALCSMPTNIEECGQAMSSHVSVTISGKRFRIACEEGQEPRLTDLAAELDRRIGKLRESYGDIGDRLVIMAALTLADELTEAVARVRRAEAELTDQRNA